MARIPYPDPEQIPEVTRAALATMAAPLNLMRMAAHAPMLVKPLLMLSNTVFTRLALTERLRELVILRTAWQVRCEYVLAQHRVLGLRLGLDVAEIEAICADTVPEGVLAPAETMVLDAIDQISAGATVDEDLAAALDREFGHQGVVEIFIVVGHYRMLAGLLSGLAVDIDPQGEKFTALSRSRSAARRPVNGRY